MIRGGRGPRSPRRSPRGLLLPAGILAAFLLLLSPDLRAGDTSAAVLAEARAILQNRGTASPSELQRRLAALGSRAIPSLLELRRECSDAGDREILTRVLARLLGTDLDRYLAGIVAGGGDPSARGKAIEDLERFGSLSVLPDLVRAMPAVEGRDRRELRAAITAMLGRVPEEEVSRTLEALWTGAPEPAKPDLLISTLDTCAPAVLPFLTDRMGRDRRIDLLIVSGLGQMQPGGAAEPLVRKLRPLLGDEDAVFRREAARALGQLEAEDAIGELLLLLEDPDRGVRENALWALRNITGLRFPPDLLRWRLWYEGERSWWSKHGRRELTILDHGTVPEIAEALADLSQHRLHRDLIRERIRALLEHESRRVRELARAALPHDGGGAAEGRGPAGAATWFSAPPEPAPPEREVTPRRRAASSSPAGGDAPSIFYVAGVLIILLLLARILGLTPYVSVALRSLLPAASGSRGRRRGRSGRRR